jgi:Zn-dependent protease
VEANAFRVSWLFYVQRFLMIFSLMNLCLAIFNLIPIPPLDGYHLVNDVLLKGRLQLNRQTFWICQIALMAVCFGTDILSNLLTAAEEAVQSGLITLLTALFGIG